MSAHLAAGKLPAELLNSLLKQAPVFDPRVLLGPGIGLDCAVVENGDSYLVFKSDPITFTSDQIGWYAVQVNCNDIATTGALPRWMLVTLLLPESATTSLAETIFAQVYAACEAIGVSVIGGHTEITIGLDRPILGGTMIGEVPPNQLVTPRGAAAGDSILLSKGVPIEATSILARELAPQLLNIINEEELRLAADFIFDPGIGILKDARLALQAGRVTAMHDPTEGGLLSALWELAQASQHALLVDFSKVPVPPLARRICTALQIDPLASIASGALLLTAPPDSARLILAAWKEAGIAGAQIGRVGQEGTEVWDITTGEKRLARRPERDEIARIFAAQSSREA